MPQSAPVLIIGANGKTGSRVDALLREQGFATRPVSRSTTPSFDWTQPEGWKQILEGASAAYVTFQPDLAIEGASDAIGELSRLAYAEGLERIVLLSGRGEPGAQQAELALQASGVDWTIVRSSWFDQNFSEGYLIDGVLAGEIALPAGTISEPFIDIDDIAEVAAAALTENGHANRLYEVTGPRLLTFSEAVNEISKAVGRPIRYLQITSDEFVTGLRDNNVPDDLVDLMNELFTVVLDGRNAHVAQGVEEALGRPARDFSDYVRKAAATGIWDI